TPRAPHRAARAALFVCPKSSCRCNSGRRETMAENTIDRKYGGGERKPLGPAPTWEQVLQRNSIERLKREKPLHTLLSDELEALSIRHYLEIPEEDIVRLKWYGLYHDKPKIGTFMLRIKIPAGLLPPESVRAIGEISNQYGEGYAELS